MYAGANLSHVPRQAASAEPEAAGVLIPITSDLIRQQRVKDTAPVKEGVRHLTGQAGPYTIGIGDVLNIVVWSHPDLALPMAGAFATAADIAAPSGVGNGYNVSANGTIQFPLVGPVAVLGLTEDEAQSRLTDKLADFIKNPQLTVRIQSYRSGRVYLDGQINRPGLQTLNDLPLTLPEALARAGGVTPSGDLSKITITRNDKSTVVDMLSLTEAGINPSSILLKAGDMVRVPSLLDSKVYVLGEVLRPTAMLMRNGRLTLNEALGEGAGISGISGNPQQVYVVRSDEGLDPQIYHLNASTPTAYALAEGFNLKPRDVVYVDPVPLVRWNRVISLLLPSSSALINWSNASTAVKQLP